MKRVVSFFWPSAVLGAIGTALLFSILDPVDLVFVGPLELGREAGYTVGFFFFWAMAAGSSWLTCLLQKKQPDALR